MKKVLLCSFLSLLVYAAWSQSQTRTSNDVRVTIPQNWVSATSAGVKAPDDKAFNYTKSLMSQSGITSFLDFGFSIPTDAVITGIDVHVRKFKKGKSDIKDLTVSLAARSVDTWCSYGKRMDAQDPALWSTSARTFTYRQPAEGTSDYFGGASLFKWTPALINDRFFGLDFATAVQRGGGGAASYIDHVAITVHYSRPGAVTTRAAVAAEVAKPFEVKVLTNPTYSTFQLQTAGGSLDPVSIRITDQLGRLVMQQASLPANGIHHIGAAFAPGVYVAEIMQASQRKVLKLVKKQ